MSELEKLLPGAAARYHGQKEEEEQPAKEIESYIAEREYEKAPDLPPIADPSGRPEITNNLLPQKKNPEQAARLKQLSELLPGAEKPAEVKLIEPTSPKESMEGLLEMGSKERGAGKQTQELMTQKQKSTEELYKMLPAAKGYQDPERVRTAKARKHFGDMLYGAAKVLGVGENAMVATTRWLMGKESKESFTDNTYSAMLIEDFGMQDDAVTRSLGLALSIVGDPLTYMSFGVGAFAKAKHVKSGTITLAKKAAKDTIESSLSKVDNAMELAKEKLIKEGFHGDALKGQMKLATKEIKKQAAEEIRQAEAFLRKDYYLSKRGDKYMMNEVGSKLKDAEKKLGRKLTPEELVSERVKATDQAFNELAAATEIARVDGKVSKAALQARKDYFDAGGAKLFGKTLGVPNTGIALSSENAIEIIHKARLPQLYNRFVQTVPGKEIDSAMKFLKETFKTSKYQDEVVDVAEIMKREEMAVRERFALEAKEWDSYFSDLSLKEQSEFANIMIDARNKEEIRLGIKDATKMDMSTTIKEIIAEKGQAAVDKIRAGVREGAVELASNKKIADKMIDFIDNKLPTIAKQARISESEALTFYFPFIDKGYFKNFRPDLKVVDVQGLAPSIPGFQIKAKTMGERALRTPVEAMTIRMTTIAQAEAQDRIFSKVARNYGQKFKDISEAAASNYVPLMDHATEIRRSMLFSKDLDINKFKDVYIPRDVFNTLKKRSIIYRANIPILSASNRLFKTLVTVPFPSFHFRNMMSNMVQNAGMIGTYGTIANHGTVWMDRFKRLAGKAILKKDLDTMINLGDGTRITLRKLREDAMEDGIFSNFFIEDLMPTLDRGDYMTKRFWKNAWDRQGLMGTAKAAGGTLVKQGKIGSQDFILNKVGMTIGRNIEDNAKFVNYMYWRRQGLDRNFAARYANDALFDYSDLTKWEAWLKEIFPFYTFTKKNIELQAKLLLHKPGFAANQLKIFRELGPDDRTWEAAPEWVKKNFTLFFNGHLISHGMTPLEDFGKVASFEEVTNRLAPWIKWSLEKGIGRSLGLDKPLKHLTRANEFKYLYDVQSSSWAPMEMKQLAGTVLDFMGARKGIDGRITVDPAKIHFLRSFGGGRYLSTIGLMGKEDVSKYKLALRTLFGLNALSVHSRTRVYYINKEKRSRFDDMLIEKGHSYSTPAGAWPSKSRFVGTYDDAKDLVKMVRKDIDEFSEAGRVVPDSYYTSMAKLIDQLDMGIKGRGSILGAAKALSGRLRSLYEDETIQNQRQKRIRELEEKRRQR